MVETLLISATLSLLAVPGIAEQRKLIPLSVLVDGCQVARRPYDLVVAKPSAAWLECGELRVLIVHPHNLIEKVKIKTESDALEFVRFFTSPWNYDLFELDGLVEIVPSKNPLEGDFNEVEEEVFGKYFRRPIVERNNDPGGRAWFDVTRYVVGLDARVYEIVENVREDGYYTILSRRFVIEAERVGIQHFGEI